MTWFSYLGGDDIRQNCHQGAGTRYRFVYNAIWGEAVRTYDIRILTPGQGGRLQARRFGAIHLLSDAIYTALGGRTGEQKSIPLRNQQVIALEQALAQSKFPEPAPEGLFLRSDDFYWTVAGCRDGRFHYNAWRNRGGAFERAEFIPALLALDPLTEPAPAPRRMALPPFANVTQTSTISGDAGQHFQVQVGNNGLKTSLSF